MVLVEMLVMQVPQEVMVMEETQVLVVIREDPARVLGVEKVDGLL